jgi:hypothetical protein
MVGEKSRRIYSHPFVLRPRPSSAPSERSAVNIATQGSAKPPPWAESCNRFAVEESHIADRCFTNHLSPFLAPGAVGDAGVVSICECTLSVQIKMLQSVTESDLLALSLFRSLPGFVELPFCENGNLKSQGLRCFRRLAWIRGSVR